MTIWLQISAGVGPDECCLVVAKVAGLISGEAKLNQTELQLIEAVEGKKTGTFQSILFSLDCEAVPTWLQPWMGSIKWVGTSPYRPNHGRKNWFVGVQVLQPPESFDYKLSDVRIDTCRASGPGGQHVNKTDSAVRATHVPTGLVAISQDARSQSRNRNLAIERLMRKLQAVDEGRAANSKLRLHNQHSKLERGSAAKTFEGKGFNLMP